MQKKLFAVATSASDAAVPTVRAQNGHFPIANGPLGKIRTQHAQGKLTAGERLQALFDHNTFKIITPQFGNPPDLQGIIIAVGQVHGRRVFVAAQDFTVKGGSVTNAIGVAVARMIDVAVDEGVPYMTLNDSGGAFIPEGVPSLDGYSQIFKANVRASGRVPSIAAILGPCAGGAAYSPACMDFIFAVEKARISITGARVIFETTGEKTTDEELAGAVAQAKRGTITNVYRTEHQLFAAARELIGMLPPNFKTLARQGNDPYAVDRDCVETEALLRERQGMVFDSRVIIEELLDDYRYFELAPTWADSWTIGFGHLYGRLIGIVASRNHLPKAGALGAHQSRKIARFVQFCKCFSIPYGLMNDVMGFWPAVEEEEAGVIPHGANMLFQFHDDSDAERHGVPHWTLQLGSSFGGAYAVMGDHRSARYVAAYPFAQIAVMGPDGAIEHTYKGEYAAAMKLTGAEKDAALNRLRERYIREYMSVDEALRRGYVHEIIQPRDTRQKLHAATERMMSGYEMPTRPIGKNPPL